MAGKASIGRSRLALRPVGEPQLTCPRCGRAHGAEDLLDHCSVSWPNQSWLSFTCRHCRRSFHVEVRKGRLAIGDIDGAPGPCFIPSERVAVPGLVVSTKDANGIRLTYAGRTWFFTAR